MFSALRGMGIREKILSAVGASELYAKMRALQHDRADLLAKLEQQRSEQALLLGEAEVKLAHAIERERSEQERQSKEAEAQLARAVSATEAAQATTESAVAISEEAKAKLVHFEGLKGADRLIELDFAIKPKVRHGWGAPSEPRLQKIIAAGRDHYLSQMHGMRPFIDAARQIPSTTTDPGEPHWINDWLPAFDAFSIYSYLAARNPETFLEIGSGTSTKFARRAIRDHGLRTRVISIDPYPRSEIDRICDEVIRSPLEETSLSAFEKLKPGDILFFDGSHRAFQNSDVTVFFTEILPGVPKGVLMGVHDIFLPDDYPPEWLPRFYSEQYLLASWLLAGDALNIELPIWYCSRDADVRRELDELWTAPNLAGANIHGGIFWFTGS